VGLEDKKLRSDRLIACFKQVKKKRKMGNMLHLGVLGEIEASQLDNTNDGDELVSLAASILVYTHNI
jgi:hypothetical protein